MEAVAAPALASSPGLSSCAQTTGSVCCARHSSCGRRGSWGAGAADPPAAVLAGPAGGSNSQRHREPSAAAEASRVPAGAAETAVTAAPPWAAQSTATVLRLPSGALNTWVHCRRTSLERLEDRRRQQPTSPGPQRPSQFPLCVARCHHVAPTHLALQELTLPWQACLLQAGTSTSPQRLSVPAPQRVRFSHVPPAPARGLGCCKSRGGQLCQHQSQRVVACSCGRGSDDGGDGSGEMGCKPTACLATAGSCLCIKPRTQHLLAASHGHQTGRRARSGL